MLNELLVQKVPTLSRLLSPGAWPQEAPTAGAPTPRTADRISGFLSWCGLAAQSGRCPLSPLLALALALALARFCCSSPHGEHSCVPWELGRLQAPWLLGWGF